MTDLKLPFDADFRSFLGSSFVVACLVLLTFVGAGMWAMSFLFNGQMTFIIKNGTQADIANVHLSVPEFKASTGKLKPGESRTYKFESHRECSAELDIEFSPDKSYELPNLCYLDGMETDCQFLLLDKTLEVRHRSTKVRKGQPGDQTPQGVGVCNYATGKYEYDKNRD